MYENICDTYFFSIKTYTGGCPLFVYVKFIFIQVTYRSSGNWMLFEKN